MPPNETTEPKPPTRKEVQDLIKTMPKAKLFFGQSMALFSRNDMLRIISFLSITGQEHRDNLQKRIKILEEQNESINDSKNK